jgi:hypothetical protein
LNAAGFSLPPLHRASQNTPWNTGSTGAGKPRSHRAQRRAAADLAGTWTKRPVRLSTSWLLIRHGTPSTFLVRVDMRRQIRPFTVEIKNRRKPTENSIPGASWGRLIDEPAGDEVPSRDIHEDLCATVGDDNPFAAANRKGQTGCASWTRAVQRSTRGGRETSDLHRTVSPEVRPRGQGRSLLLLVTAALGAPASGRFRSLLARGQEPVHCSLDAVVIERLI